MMTRRNFLNESHTISKMKNRQDEDAKVEKITKTTSNTNDDTKRFEVSAAKKKKTSSTECHCSGKTSFFSHFFFLFHFSYSSHWAYYYDCDDYNFVRLIRFFFIRFTKWFCRIPRMPPRDTWLNGSFVYFDTNACVHRCRNCQPFTNRSAGIWPPTLFHGKGLLLPCSVRRTFFFFW